ncbi:MAG: hypothetical protein F6K14_26760 [Symploca sp. SIO2C1]|nr:hypothetical protein [Symploca sp. SIO2C1]
MNYPSYVYPNRSSRDRYSLVSFEDLPVDALPFFILWRGTLYTPSSDHIPIDLAAAQAWLNDDSQKQAYKQEKLRLESGSNNESGSVNIENENVVAQQAVALTFEQIFYNSNLLGTGAVCRLPGGNWALEKRDSIFYKDLEVVSGALMTHQTNVSLQLYETFSYQNPAVINDVVRWKVNLNEGSYSLFLLGSPSTNRGIIALEIDNINQGTVDWYSSVFQYNITKIMPFVITTNGEHFIDLKVVGKNAASSDYFNVVTKLWIK